MTFQMEITIKNHDNLIKITKENSTADKNFQSTKIFSEVFQINLIGLALNSNQTCSIKN